MIWSRGARNVTEPGMSYQMKALDVPRHSAHCRRSVVVPTYPQQLVPGMPRMQNNAYVSLSVGWRC